MTKNPEIGYSFADSVMRFMICFDQMPVICGQPVSKEDLELGAKLIEEECMKEFIPAFVKWQQSQSLENLAEMVDGAIDTIYVIIWMMNKAGVPVNECFAEIQRSNMAKLQSDGSVKKNEFGKVVKPETWTPPNLMDILIEASSGQQHYKGIIPHVPKATQK